MEDNEYHSLPPEIQELGKELIGHEIFDKQVDTYDKVTKTAVYQVVRLLFEEDYLSMSELVNKFDTRTFLSNIIKDLEQNNFIEVSGEELSPSMSFLESLIERKMSIKEEDTDNITGQPSYDKDSSDIDQSSPDKPPSPTDQPPSPTDQPLSTPPMTKTDKADDKSSEIPKSDDSEIEKSLNVANQKQSKSTRRRRKKGEFSEEQLNEIDKAITGDRPRRDKLLESMTKSPDEQEPTQQEDDLDFDTLFDEELGGSITDELEWENDRTDQSTIPKDIEDISQITEEKNTSNGDKEIESKTEMHGDIEATSDISEERESTSTDPEVLKTSPPVSKEKEINSDRSNKVEATHTVSDEDKSKPDITKTKDVTQILIENLNKFNYIQNDQRPTETIEYKILRAIFEHHPISSEEIDEKLSDETLTSMHLSNLKADDLISQTSDYRWTLSKYIFTQLETSTTGDEEETSETTSIDPDKTALQAFLYNDREQFLEALYKMDYISEKGKQFTDYLNEPEIEILNIIREAEPIGTDKIKNMVDNTLPVVVTRTLSKLNADEIIISNSEGNWELTKSFYYLMVRDEMSENMSEEELTNYDNKLIP